MGDKARAGDGVVAGAGLIDGRPVFCYAQDSSFAGGSLGEQHANTIVRVLELADKAKAPVVGFVSSGGARMQEGVAALGGYGRIFHRIVKLSGRVPQISIVTGLSAGGAAYSPALTDWVVMTEESSMFLTGPGVVREALGEDVTAAQLGGTRVHERNGVCHFVAPTDVNAAYLARELLGYLPRHRGARPPVHPVAPAARTRPVGPGPGRRAERLRRARRGSRSRRRRRAARGVRGLGAQPRHRLRAARRPHGRRRRQPAALPRRDHRRRRRAEGRALRQQVRRVRHPAGRARRHARLHAGHQAGVRRRDPVRRGVRARVRRGRGAARDADPAQGVRRRVHHDELQGPRRRLRVRVAERPDRRDGRQVRGRDHQPARARGGRGSRRRPRSASPSATPRRTCARGSPPPPATSTS